MYYLCHVHSIKGSEARVAPTLSEGGGKLNNLSLSTCWEDDERLRLRNLWRRAEGVWLGPGLLSSGKSL